MAVYMKRFIGLTVLIALLLLPTLQENNRRK